MTIVKRTGLGRAMTWSELDGNWDQVVESTAAAQQSAALAAASQAAAATSEANAAQSASDAASQAEAAGTLRTDLASTDAGKGLSMVSAEDGTNGQTLFDNADQFAGAYEDAIITITSVNRWITYDGSRWYVKPGTTVPFTTTGLNASSWATDSANFINPESVIKADLLSNSGFELIGRCSSYSELKTVTPSSAGLYIELASYYNGWQVGTELPTGGGVFVSVAGSETDDLGSICVPTGQTEFYWLRMSDVVKTVDYGIKFTDYNLTDTTDYSTNLQNAINFAVSNKVPLECHIPTYGQDLDYGIYISKGINITGLSELIGNLNLFLNSANGFTGLSAPGIASPFALINLNGTMDSQGLVYNTPSGKQKLGSGIHVRQFAPRGDAYDLSGQCHIFSGTNWDGALTARNFYGHGIYVGSCWDWTGNEIRVYGCGTTTYWAIRFGSYPAASGSTADETNNAFLASLFIHDCYDKIYYNVSTALVIQHIHQERNHITSTTAWVDESTTVSAGQTDYTYLNNFVQIRSGSIGQWGIYEDSGTQTTNGSPVVTLIRTLGTDIGVLNSTGQVAISPPLGTTFADGNSFGVLSASSVKINASARVNANIVMAPSTTLLTGMVSCASNYADIDSIQAATSVSMSGGSKAGLVSSPSLSMAGAYVDRAICPTITMTGVSMLGYTSATTITSNGKSTIGGGNVTTLNMQGSSYKSGSVIEKITIGTLNSTEGMSINGITVTGDSTFTDCSPYACNCSFYNLYYVGSKSIDDLASINSSRVSNNLQLNGYYSGVLNNVKVEGTLQTKGASLAVSINDCYAGSWNLNCDSGYFTISNPKGSSVAYWSITNNVPNLGAICVNPNTGVWYRYTSSGWVTL